MDETLLQQAREALAAHEAVVAEHAGEIAKLRRVIAILEGKGEPPPVVITTTLPFLPPDLVGPVPMPPFRWEPSVGPTTAPLRVTCGDAFGVSAGPVIGPPPWAPGSGSVQAANLELPDVTIQITGTPLEHLNLS